MKRVAIIENSEGLGHYFTKPFEENEYVIYPVWKTNLLPGEYGEEAGAAVNYNEDTAKVNDREKDGNNGKEVHDHFDAYIFTGDFNNITDGLLPIHEKEIEFVRSIRDKKIFGSCFFHQLLGHIFGGKVGKRDHRFFGWHPFVIENDHPVFKDLEDQNFLNLNIDEVIEYPMDCITLGTNQDCTYQFLQYGDDILTCQSHPEIFLEESIELIIKHEQGLKVRCPDLEEILERTIGSANDEMNRRFMFNLREWLFM